MFRVSLPHSLPTNQSSAAVHSSTLPRSACQSVESLSEGPTDDPASPGTNVKQLHHSYPQLRQPPSPPHLPVALCELPPRIHRSNRHSRHNLSRRRWLLPAPGS